MTANLEMLQFLYLQIVTAFNHYLISAECADMQHMDGHQNCRFLARHRLENAVPKLNNAPKNVNFPKTGLAARNA
eukprot:6475618-Amphidinium_carterae.2